MPCLYTPSGAKGQANHFSLGTAIPDTAAELLVAELFTACIEPAALNPLVEKNLFPV